MDNQCTIKLVGLITSIVFAGSAQLIIIPLIMPIYQSILFINILFAVESLVVFAAIMLVNDIYGWYMGFQWAFNYVDMIKNIGMVFLIGFVQFIISSCFFYSAHPARTPILIQVILLGLGILPSVILSKLMLKKSKDYNMKYIFISLCFLLASIMLGVFPIIPFYKNFNVSFIWCGVYALAVILISLSYVLQEQYILATDRKASTKFKLAFYSRLVQAVFIVIMFWIEPFLGYNANGDFYKLYTDFIDSWYVFINNGLNFWLIQLYVISRVVSYILMIYLNQISANYSTIIGNINTQILALFFAIFPELNKGFQYPLVVIMMNIFCNISSIIFWINGEKNITNEDDKANDIEIELMSLKNPMVNPMVNPTIPSTKKSKLFKKFQLC